MFNFNKYLVETLCTKSLNQGPRYCNNCQYRGSYPQLNVHPLRFCSEKRVALKNTAHSRFLYVVCEIIQVSISYFFQPNLFHWWTFVVEWSDKTWPRKESNRERSTTWICPRPLRTTSHTRTDVQATLSWTLHPNTPDKNVWLPTYWLKKSWVLTLSLEEKRKKLTKTQNKLFGHLQILGTVPIKTVPTNLPF